ncbi:MAG: sodium-dependent transporter [Alcanivoracaceae bacterium]|jgi:NSS family neurotransmitter:Na+ symporter|nr:sodium-dependent transporter [Alcanivoracaceae bacterium]
MDKSSASLNGIWTSRWVFILAATGSAVGLGNIWKFPYITGEYGGGAFVLMYLLIIALVGVPVMVAEVMMGRRGGMSPINSMKKLAGQAEVSSRWKGLGYLGALAGFLILTFYSVIAGWALYYIVAMPTVLVGADAVQVAAVFDGLLASPLTMLLCHSLFMMLTVAVVLQGIHRGLQRAVQVLMPALFIMLLVLLGYAMTTGGFNEAVAFMFTVDFSKLSSDAVLVAMGHSFFTLSLGLGAIMAYGAYMPREVSGKDGRKRPVSIGSTVLTIAFLDTLVALVAGLCIFPVVFANGLEPAAGPGLLFQTLPLAFAQMPAGVWFGGLFFVLVLFAAWSSSISLLEPLVAWLVEAGWSRTKATMLLGLAAWLIGIGSVLSFNLWSETTLFGKTIFGVLDFLTTNIMLPLGGLLIALFAGWVMKDSHARKELNMTSFKVYLGWRVAVRILAPLAILAVFAHGIGLI